MALTPKYWVYVCDDTQGAGTWPTELPNSADADTSGTPDPNLLQAAMELDGTTTGYTPETAATNTGASNWRVIRFRCAEALSTVTRFEVTLAIWRPLESEDKYTAADNPQHTIYGDGPVGLVADLITGTNPLQNESLGQYLLDQRRQLHTDWAVSKPIWPAQFLGRRLTLAVSHDTVTPTATGRFFSGIVTEFLKTSDAVDPNYRVVNVVVQPQLWKLSLRTNCRVFSNSTAMEIVAAVLKDANIYQGGSNEISYYSTTGTTTPDQWTNKREYTVQYNETDLNFVQRLLEEEGITYCFDHRKLVEGIIFCEDLSQIQTNASRTGSPYPAMPLTLPPTTTTVTTESAWGMRVHSELRTQVFTGRDFTYWTVNPTAEGTMPDKVVVSGPLPTTAPTAPPEGSAPYEAYEYPAREPWQANPVPQDGDLNTARIDPYASTDRRDRAKFRMDAEQTRTFAGHATSNVAGVFAGGFVSASNLPAAWKLPAPNPAPTPPTGANTFLITAAEHVGYPSVADIPNIQASLPAYITANQILKNDTSGSHDYLNRIDFVVADASNPPVTFRPLRVTPRPVIYGVHPGIVVDDSYPDYPDSKSGDTPLPPNRIVWDQIGRVKVRFLWDRRGDTAFNPAPSGSAPLTAWLRVVQPWAGDRFGVQFLPRWGTSVVVMFEDGDPDRPIVVGSIHDALHHPFLVETTHKYFGAKIDNHRIGIRTQSHGGDANATNSNPGGGNELWFHDLAGSEKIYIHAEGKLHEEVLHFHQTEVEGQQTITVHGTQVDQITRDQTLNVDGPERHLVFAGNFSESAAERHTKIHNGLDSTRIEGNRNEVVVGTENLAIGTEGKDPSCPLDADKLQTALAKRDAAMKVYTDDVATFRSKNDDYCEWLTRLRDGDNWLHGILSSIGIAEKPLDHVKDLAKLVNVGANPPLKLNGGYTAQAPDGEFGGYLFAQDALDNPGQDGVVDSIATDTDALNCPDGDITKSLRKDYKALKEADQEVQLQQSLVRNILAKGLILTQIGLDDVLEVLGDRTEKVEGSVLLSGKSVTMSSGQTAPGQPTPPASQPQMTLATNPPGSDPGLQMRVDGGTNPDAPAVLALAGHAPASQDPTKVTADVIIAAKNNLNIQASTGFVKVRTAHTTQLDFGTDGYVNLKADDNVVLLATDTVTDPSNPKRGFVSLREGMFLLQFNTDPTPDDSQAAKAPTMSFEIVSDLAKPLNSNPPVDPPDPGFWLRALDITTSGSSTVVMGDKGIVVQSGNIEERILSPGEEAQFAAAAQAEKTFQAARDKAKDATEDREKAHAQLQKALAAQAAANSDFLKAVVAFEQAKVAYKAWRAAYIADVHHFHDKNADFAEAINKLAKRDSGGILASIGIINSPLANVQALGPQVSAASGSGDAPIDRSDADNTYAAVAYKSKGAPLDETNTGPVPTHPELQDRSKYFLFETYTFAEARESDGPVTADTTPWTDLVDEGDDGAEEAADRGVNGTLTAQVLNDRVALGIACRALDAAKTDLETKLKTKADKDQAAGTSQTAYDKASGNEDALYGTLNNANAAAVAAHAKAHDLTQYAQLKDPDQ